MLHANLPYTVDRRVESRVPVSIKGCFRRLGNMAHDLEFKDLSPSGFRMLTATKLKIGELLWVYMPRIGSRPAVVKWQDGEQYGCEFRTPISKAYVYVPDQKADISDAAEETIPPDSAA